jgi:hypothetical protein
MGLFYDVEIWRHLIGHLQCPEEEIIANGYKAKAVPDGFSQTFILISASYSEFL